MSDLERFLATLGLEQYAAVLAENDVDLDILPSLSDGDLKELGLSLGHRRRLLRALQAGGTTESTAEPATAPTTTPRVEAERRQLTVLTRSPGRPRKAPDLAAARALMAELVE